MLASHHVTPMRCIGLVSLSIAVQSIAAQSADMTSPRTWIAAGAGLGSLGSSAEASVWFASDRLAVGARWSQTVADGYGSGSGSGDKNELAALVGIAVPVWRGTLIPAAGLARAGGCYTVKENERCTSLGVEPALAWGLELDAPASGYVGIHVAGLGVQGQRTRYVGLSLGLTVGRLR